MAVFNQSRNTKGRRTRSPAYTSRGDWDSQCWFPPLELAALVAAGLDPNATVLDVGCGHGTETIFLSRMGWKKVYGIADKESIDLAKQYAARFTSPKPRVQFAAMDLGEGVPALPDKWPKSFDLVLDRLCINNFIASEQDSQRDRRIYFRRMSELVRKGGLLFIRDRWQGDNEATFRRQMFFAERPKEFFGASHGDRFFSPLGPIVNVRLVGDDTERPNRLDAMVPITGVLAVLKRI